MRVSLKVLGLLWVGLFLIIGALLFNAYSKFKPESFVALLTEQVQKNYPGASLTVEKVSYRFSLDFILHLQNVHLKRSDKILSSMGELELKVPWWLLLFNRGNAHINVKDLEVFVDHKVKAPVEKTSETSSSNDLIKVSIPSYLSDAEFTLRAKNITIRDLRNSRRYFVLSKLLVREFRYGKNSAFELNVPITITQNEDQYKSELWLFGDVTPDPEQWLLNFRGEFRTKESNDKFNMEDIVIGGKATFAPASLNVDSEMALEIEKKLIGTGTFKADDEALSVNLDFTYLPLTYFGLIYEEIKNPYLQKLEGDAEGNVSFKKVYDAPLANVTGKLNFAGAFQLTNKDSIPGKWQVTFQDSRWEVSFMSPKGEASFFRRSFMDPRKNAVTQFIEEIGFSGLDMTLTVSPVKPVIEFISETPHLYFTTLISYKNCLLNDQVLNGTFKYGYSPVQKFYQGQLTDEKTSYKINYSDKSSQRSLDLAFENFIWNPAYHFLAPLFNADSGILNGTAEGRWDSSWEKGKWAVQLKMEKLQMPKGKIPQFIDKSFSFFSVDTAKFSDQSLNISGKNELISLNSLMLQNTESVKISGHLSTTKKSYLTLSYPKKKQLKPVKKEVMEPYWLEKEEL